MFNDIDLDDTSDYAHSFDSGSTNEQSLEFYRPDLLRLGLGFTKHSTLSLARSGEMEFVCTFLELTNTFRFCARRQWDVKYCLFPKFIFSCPSRSVPT